MDPWWGDIEWEDADDDAEPAALEVDIADPQPLAVLYDHTGTEAWTLYDKRTVPFGYQAGS